MRSPILLAGILLMALSVPARARVSRPSARYRSVLVRGVPFVQQRPDFCGEACVEMGLRRLGYNVSQDDVFAVAKIAPKLGRGAIARELRHALIRLGFEPGKVWYRIDRQRSLPEVEKQFRSLHGDLVTGVPSIVCSYYDSRPGTTQHFRLVVGYDAARDEVIYHEPAEENGAYRRMPRGRFLALWPLRYRPTDDILIRMPLHVREIHAPPHSTERPSPADRVQQIMKSRSGR